MAKVAIVNGTTGQLSDICDEADKFEIYEGPDTDMKWCEVPDDATYEHYMVNGVVIHREEAEDGIRDSSTSRGLGDVYKRQRWRCSRKWIRW